jgi:glucose uptake protein
MVIVQSYPVAVALCFLTMLCWGSWANTQKLAEKEWRFQLFYWDYAIGVVLISLVLAFTMGSTGSEGRGFAADLAQAGTPALVSALIGGVVFNVANILLVAAIDIAGMSVAFPIGIGLALVIGVLANYMADPVGNPALLFLGVAGVAVAIVVDALAYRRLPSVGTKTSGKGIAVSIIAGLLMGFFYRFVAASMVSDFAKPEAGKLTPYTAVVLFSIGLFLSNFVFNSIVMARPLAGDPVPFADYFRKGSPRLHAIGVLGGAIWGLGMSFSIIASGQAGVAISYGLGQGATMIAALWGVFVWKEFKQASPGTGKLLALMFFGYVAGLGLIIAARLV